MSDIEKLREAASLIRNVCENHKCDNCPLYRITCNHMWVYVPKVWPVDKIGEKR